MIQNMREDSFALGDTFPTMKEARQALQRHTEIQGLPYKVKKAESSRYIAVCRSDNQCNFYIRIHWSTKEQNAVVSTYRRHTCHAVETQVQDNRIPTPAPPSPLANIPDPHPFEVGDTFPTLKEAQQALLRHMAHHKLSYRVKKSESNRYIAVCRSGDSCTFYVRLSWRNREQNAAIATYRPHTCNPETHDNWPAASSVKYLSEKHHEAFSVNPNLKPADIKRLELEQGNRVTFKQAWRTLKCVKQDFGLEERPPPKKSRAEKAKERKLLKDAGEMEERSAEAPQERIAEEMPQATGE